MSTSNGYQLYLLNTPVLTAYGEWQFEGPISPERVREMLAAGFVSAIGHGGSAQFLTRLLDTDVQVNRINIQMQPGDRAVILRLMERLPEGIVLTDEQMQNLPFELGLLTRVS